MLMVMYTKVNGRMIRLMDLENIYIQTVLNTKDSGKKINSTVSVRRHGLMVHATRVTTLRVKRTVKVNSNGQMDLHIKDSSWITTFTDVECTYGLTTEDMKDSG
jgi:hypothetical protein